MRTESCTLAFLILLGFGLPARSEPVVSSATLNRKLDSFPLAGRGQAFVSEGSAYGVDPRLIVAIAGAESTFGSHLCAAFNAWNWFWGGTCTASPFESYERGLHTVSKYMKKSYLLRGYSTIEQIGAKYCAAGCEHWVPNVSSFYTELGGDRANLSYAHLTQPAPPTPKPKPPQPKAQTAPEPEPEDGGSPLLLYTLLAAGGLLVLAGIGALVGLLLRGRGARP